MQAGRDDAGRTVGGGGDDTSTCCVLLIDRQGPHRQPVDRSEGFWLAWGDALPGSEIAVHLHGTATHVQSTWENAGAGTTTLDARVHDGPDVQEFAAHVFLVADGHLIGHGDLGDAHPVIRALFQQFLAGLEGVGDRSRVADDGGVLVLTVFDDEATADGVEGALGDDLLARPGRERHAVGVEGQGTVAMQDEVCRDVEGNLPTTMDGIEGDASAVGDGGGSSWGLVGVDGGGILSLQAQQDGGFGAMSVSGRPQ